MIMWNHKGIRKPEQKIRRKKESLANIVSQLSKSKLYNSGEISRHLNNHEIRGAISRAQEALEHYKIKLEEIQEQTNNLRETYNNSDIHLNEFNMHMRRYSRKKDIYYEAQTYYTELLKELHLLINDSSH